MARVIGEPAANGVAPGGPAVAAVCQVSAARRIEEALRSGGVTLADTVHSVDEAAEQLGSKALDLVVFADETLNERQCAGIRLLGDRLPGMRVVVVAGTASPRATRGAFSAGAAAVILDSELDQLPHVVRLVCAGYSVLPAPTREFLLKPALSTREKQILAMVVMGFTNAGIAHKLFVTESTVKSHLSSAFRKLGVRSRNDATRLILDPENGLGAGILAISADEVEPLPLARPRS